MTSMIEQAKAAAAKLKDQTEQQATFEYEPPAAGPAIARFVSYVEVGMQPQKPHMGKPKPPCLMAIIQFELLGKKHAKEVETADENGKKTKRTVYPIITIRQAVKSGDKATFYKLLAAMDYGRKNTHMAFMLGEAFIVTVVHTPNPEDPKKVYVNLRNDAGWQIRAPVTTDPETGEFVPMKAPPATVPERLLLWDAPSIEQWNSIYIPGTYTKKENGVEVQASKNWMQDMCRKATNWEGSGLQQIVSAVEGDLPDMDADSLENLSGPADRPAAANGKSDEGDPLAGLDLDDEIAF